MLKSIDFMNRLKADLNENIVKGNISNFFIELRVNQKVDVYISSNSINSISDLYFDEIKKDQINKNVNFTFLSEAKAQSEEYEFLFNGDKTSFGLRRSLGALLGKKTTPDSSNVITFFSYKGGVGRTTSLALTATYLSRQNKNVFVIDCDFEAPGLINFFNTSQTTNSKSGLVEYLSDSLFLDSCNIEDYVYSVEKTYSGSGVINLMAAGNILNGSEHLLSYLEGLAKIDLQGERLVRVLGELINKINEKYKPDLILFDSRTGFNNTFGALAQLSNTVVVLAGDDTQNQPGIEYVAKMLSELDVNFCFVLSILSSNFSKRYSNFSNHVQSVCSFDTEVFYFDRQNTLEHIGTVLEDRDDLDDFINGENGSTQYQRFFKYIHDAVSTMVQGYIEDDKIEDFSFSEESFRNIIPEPNSCNGEKVNGQGEELLIEDRILSNLKGKLPNLYAENIDYSETYIDEYFYFRPCMEDFFIPEKNILLGDKGTGKTAFYKALQIGRFFDKLTSKSQRKSSDYKVINVTNFEDDNFEFLGFDDFIKDELFIRKFWMFFIWNAISLNSEISTENKYLSIDLGSNDARDKIIAVINDADVYRKIEEDLSIINDNFKRIDRRLIITFDQLDNIVKPFLWNDVVAPLIKIVMRFPHEFIQPKLFLRRDLYERLGNLTNKHSFSSRIIDLEWSQNEIFSYFLKIVFSHSKDEFFIFLERTLSSKTFVERVKKKLKTKGIQHNQLPLDRYLIQPVINAFFGDPKPKKNGVLSNAYEDLYRNIQSADRTVNLRPFLDLITNAIQEQDEQDIIKKYRKNSIIGIAYCTSKQVRKKAVVNYLVDLWSEKGNEFVKYFCQDLANNRVSGSLKRNVLDENAFDKLLEEVKNNHITEDAIKNGTLEEFKQILIANKIITPYMVGSKTRYGFAYLYTNYLGL